MRIYVCLLRVHAEFVTTYLFQGKCIGEKRIYIIKNYLSSICIPFYILFKKITIVLFVLFGLVQRVYSVIF